MKKPTGGGRKVTRGLPLLAGVCWLVIAAYPIYYMVISSFRTPAGFLSESPWLPEGAASLENYATVINGGIGLYFVNSLFVTGVSVALITVVSLLAAYAITRVRSRTVLWVFNAFLLGLAVPYQAAIIPIFVIINKMGLYDTLYGLIPPQVAFHIPLTVLILVNFIRDIPTELYDSMVLDGAGHFRLLQQLVLPLSRPALITVIIYNSVQVWNNFLFPLILTQSSNVRTIPLALREFQGEYGVNVPGIMAAVILSVLPIVVLYVVARRQLLGGLIAGFGK
ncbi:MAG TPA: carbohydrate ABC transporter permease [Nocardioidaceae bacterium]|nr:carbohydrate ABC transporter permease [Nocardioidaceae bacterium]